MNLKQFKNIDKYTVDKLSDAVDKAVDVSFAQMIDTVRTQCYMSQTQDSWEDCTELEFLEDIPMLFTDGRKIKESIQNQMKRVVISALTEADWVGKNDAMYQHLPSDIEDRLHKNSDEYQSQFETETERLEREDEEEYDISPSGKSKPSDSFGWDTPQIDGIPNGDKLSDTDDVLVGCQTVGIKEDGWTRKSVKETNDSGNSVIILALETLLEQVRDARDFEQIARVKNILDKYKF
jgi:hypothetical protein